MKKQRKFEKDGLIVTHFGGPHTYKDAEEALTELLEINEDKKQHNKASHSRGAISIIFI